MNHDLDQRDCLDCIFSAPPRPTDLGYYCCFLQSEWFGKPVPDKVCDFFEGEEISDDIEEEL